MTYAKAIAAALVAAAGTIYNSLDDGHINTTEGLTVVLSVLASSGIVWYAINGKGARYVKAVVGGLTGLTTSMIAALGDNVITSQEWTGALIAAAVGTGLVALVGKTLPPPPEPPVVSASGGVGG